MSISKTKSPCKRPQFKQRIVTHGKQLAPSGQTNTGSMTFLRSKLGTSGFGCHYVWYELKGGSVCLNSDRGLDKWISCQVQAAAECSSLSK